MINAFFESKLSDPFNMARNQSTVTISRRDIIFNLCLQPVAATYSCGQRPQHLKGHREAIPGL